ncbi:MAG: Rrf2 family transcriptional regulator [Dethiobacter sp.]|nr:Rrf2 family transcriptional regulator [Dethiobacter sp.]MBS4055159.1 Rrf2 family transcriptional regulator [Thermaerobacter sp.]
MRLSTKGQYAVRALVVVALHGDSGPVSLRFIAEREDISEQYLEQIFMDLRRAALVTGIRGAGGGYILAKSPAEITSGDIVRAVEGPIRLVDCDHNGPCERVHVCVTRELWSRVSASMSQVLDDTTLAHLAACATEKISQEVR